MSLFATAKARLIVRAIMAGLAAFAVQIHAGGSGGSAAIIAAVTAGAWSALEYLTPVNRSVGHGKSPGTPQG